MGWLAKQKKNISGVFSLLSDRITKNFQKSIENQNSSCDEEESF